MLARLHKLAHTFGVLRKDALEKRAVIGALGGLAGKAALTAAKHPVATLSAVGVAAGTKPMYQKNMSKFRVAHGLGEQNVPTPPGVG